MGPYPVGLDPPGNVLGYVYPSSNCAPSLLIGLINMFMMKDRPSGFVNETTGVVYNQCYLNLWYPGQVRLILLSCIPCFSYSFNENYLLN
ncbi:unnamed protein product [Anisakis simplex]|uniref:FGGY_C domain-containing protein n=1 Tax=Anisakis simplex TaxID=6269 RepID=A0A0M3KJG8_ANISI|nr:unnamed protein product [Anisakis simplex]